MMFFKIILIPVKWTQCEQLGIYLMAIIQSNTTLTSLTDYCKGLYPDVEGMQCSTFLLSYRDTYSRSLRVMMIDDLESCEPELIPDFKLMSRRQERRLK